MAPGADDGSGAGPGGDRSTAEDDADRWRHAHERPENEVGAPVPLSLVLGRTEDLAVVLTSVLAFSTGFAFEVAVRLRQPLAGDHDLFQQVSGHLGPDSLLLGVEYPDGRRASVLDVDGAWPPAGRAAAGAVSLTSSGGGGGGRAYDQAWWVHPLPPPGPVLVVVRWDAQGLPESAVGLDGAVIAGAGERAEALWPWEPERPAAGDEPPAPARPREGWFARR